MIHGLVLAAALAAAPGTAAAAGSGAPGPEAAVVPPPSSAPAAAASGPDEERARAYFTDTKLRDQTGKEVRFYSDVLAGKVVVVNFIYTRCGHACPLMTARLNALGRALGERFGREVHFVSVSVDPQDTPADLAAFAKKHQVPERGWTFLTGRREDVQLVVGRLGQWVETPEEHGTMLLVGNTRTRHWAKLRSDHATDALAAQVRRIADGNGLP